MKEKIALWVKGAVEDFFTAHGKSLDFDNHKIHIERTRDSQHGDYACNVALVLAKPLQMSPRDVATEIMQHLSLDGDVKKVEIAGPGFINFFLSEMSLCEVVEEILTKQEQYGQSNRGAGQRVLLEFVSSNPTGPLHVGHGRHAAYGAAVANLLEAIGYKVHREYYVNDLGRQMQILTVSVWLRYLELLGQTLTFPCNGYKGDYISAVAQELRKEKGEQFYHPVPIVFENLPEDEQPDGSGDKEKYIDAVIERAKNLLGEDNFQSILQISLSEILKDIHTDLEEFGVSFQEWFSERGLSDRGELEKGIEMLRAHNALYERDGAIWFAATSYGDEQDRVVIRKNGQTTYFASDVAYHLNKYNRKFDLIVDIFGSDHHGYSPRIRAFLKAAGEDEKKFQVLLVQFVNLYRGNQKISMSTRAGDFVTLRALREEVGNDAARFFYLMRKSDQHLDFDLDLAKSKSNENPVYYVQYAHARICSVDRQLAQQGGRWDKTRGLAELHQLTAPEEKDILRMLSQYPEILEAAAVNYEPHALVHYLLQLATCFHTYYNAYKFLVPEEGLRNARLCLINAIRIVVVKGLSLIGVSAPEEM